MIPLSPTLVELVPALAGLFIAAAGYALARYTVRGSRRHRG